MFVNSSMEMLPLSSTSYCLMSSFISSSSSQA